MDWTQAGNGQTNVVQYELPEARDLNPCVGSPLMVKQRKLTTLRWHRRSQGQNLSIVRWRGWKLSWAWVRQGYSKLSLARAPILCNSLGVRI